MNDHIQIPRTLLASHIAEIDSWNASMERVLGEQVGYRWESLEALRAALQQAEQQPVAWVRQSDLDDPDDCLFASRYEFQKTGYSVPLYAAPVAQTKQPEQDRIVNGFVILDGVEFSKAAILSQREDLHRALVAGDAVTAERDHALRLIETAHGFQDALEAQRGQLRADLTAVTAERDDLQSGIEFELRVKGRLEGEVVELKRERDQLRVSLSDPEAVFVNMKRGTIAKPSVRQMVDMYGEVVNGEDAQLLEIAKLRAELAAATAERDLLLAALERTVDYHVPGINPLSDAANLSAVGVIEKVKAAKQPVITGESQ